MHKIFSITFGFCLMAGTALAQMNQPYVRKKIQPNFFIPEGALAESKPEKVGMPQYRQGRTTAKRISAEPEPAPQPQNQQLQQISDTRRQTEEISRLPENQEQQIQSPIREDANETNTQTSSPVPQQGNQTDTPNYQKMYQDYLKDLDSIARNGAVNTSYIDKDLNAMNSEKRIQIDKEFNSHRNVKNDILKALEN